MSCSLIEAKFQVLDRTIKMLSKSNSLRTPRVASSEQLRELVETQKPTSLLPTIKPVRGVVVARLNQSHTSLDKSSRSQPNTSREEKPGLKQGHSPPRPSTGRREHYEILSTELLPGKWVDPKQQRAEQLLQDTWHRIQVRHLSCSAPIPLFCRPVNLRYQSCFADTATTAIHDALPPPKRPMTTAGLQSKKSKGYLSVRCQSASFTSPDHQPKNWFVPSAIKVKEQPRRATKPKRKICRHRPVTTIGRHAKQHLNIEAPSSSPEVEERPETTTPREVDVGDETTSKRTPPEQNADDLSFYMLELRLVHPEPLTDWRFQASFTDVSVSPSKTVILDDLTVRATFHSEAVASQEASLLRVLSRRNSSRASIAPRKSKSPKAKPRKRQQRPPPENNNEASTSSLAMDQCSPWTSSEQDDLTNDMPQSLLNHLFTLRLEESRSQPPSSSPRKGPTADHLGRSPLATIDKKKMQLQKLRANIRVPRAVRQRSDVRVVCADFKNHNDLPLARIKRIMKSDEDVRMISAEAPVLFAKACEMFILELTLRSWGYSEKNKRRTLQKEDIQTAIRNTDIFDFLVDVIN
ncbi:unnamed protein product [Phytophthora lilii]|uniref:Unnamed protein product n=1 Tax=Phytophthora lilii TaxID=2077276 RepID=A0A9W6UEQ5_9STRA|nr:unnamed protein product [Phytophthora lilii]